MWNPFAKPEEKKVREQQNEVADYEMQAAELSNPGPKTDIDSLLERKEALIQLSQWQQNRSPAMQKLFLKLSGYMIDKKTNRLKKVQWEKDVNYGVVSLEGAYKLVNFIEPLDHNVMLANWDTKNVIVTMRDAIAHPLRRFIFWNHLELNLSLEHAEYVFWLIVNTVEPTYWRGWNDGERRKDKEIIKINELRNPYFKNVKKGIFGKEM
jgi:hypothetical protein